MAKGLLTPPPRRPLPSPSPRYSSDATSEASSISSSQKIHRGKRKSRRVSLAAQRAPCSLCMLPPNGDVQSLNLDPQSVDGLVIRSVNKGFDDEEALNSLAHLEQVMTSGDMMAAQIEHRLKHHLELHEEATNMTVAEGLLKSLRRERRKPKAPSQSSQFSSVSSSDISAPPNPPVRHNNASEESSSDEESESDAAPMPDWANPAALKKLRHSRRDTLDRELDDMSGVTHLATVQEENPTVGGVTLGEMLGQMAVIADELDNLQKEYEKEVLLRVKLQASLAKSKEKSQSRAMQLKESDAQCKELEKENAELRQEVFKQTSSRQTLEEVVDATNDMLKKQKDEYIDLQGSLSQQVAEWREKEEARKNAIICKITRRWQHMEMSRPFQAWVSMWETAKSHKATINKCISRVRNFSSFKAFNAWAKATKQKKILTTAAEKMLFTSSLRLTRVAFAAVHRYTRHRQRKEKVHTKVSSQRRNKIYVRCIAQWKRWIILSREVRFGVDSYQAPLTHKAQEQNLLKQVTAVVRTRTSSLSKAMHGWAGMVELRRHQIDISRKACIKFYSRFAFTIFHTWAQYVRRILRRRAVARRAILKIAHGTTARSFDAWIVSIRWQRRNRDIMSSSVAKWTRRRTTAALEAWKTSTANIHRDRRMMRLCQSRLQNLSQHRGLSSWKDMIANRREARAKIRKSVNVWQKKGLSRVFYAWATIPEINEEKESKTLTAVKKMMKGRMCRAFLGWKDAHGSLMYNKAVIDRSLRRWQHMTTGSVFESWVQWIESRRRREAIAGTVVKKMMYGALYRSLESWKSLRPQREKKEKTLNVVRQRWCNSTSYAAFQGWTSFVTERKRIKKAKRTCILNWQRKVCVQHLTAWARMSAASRRDELKGELERANEQLQHWKKSAEHFQSDLAQSEEAKSNLEKKLDDYKQKLLRERAEQAQLEKANMSISGDMRTLKQKMDSVATRHKIWLQTKKVSGTSGTPSESSMSIQSPTA